LVVFEMIKNLVISVLAVVLVVTVSLRVDAGGPKDAGLLRDGFVLAGVDGRLVIADGNAGYFFKFDSDVNDYAGRVCAGSSLELLASSTLEKMTVVFKKHSDTSCRLWGRLSRYKGRNFIFPTHFLALSKVKEPPQSQQSRGNRGINEPNDALAIPQEIMAKLTTRRVVRSEQSREGLKFNRDSILAESTGFICGAGRCARFVPDGVGRNIRGISFALLRCESLERAEQSQSAAPEQIRFKIAGILTEYKGRRYLLLQRAMRVYSYGNFDR